jgi:predicted ArsR family transcriptional regulator
MSADTREKVFQALKKHAPISIPDLSRKLNMLPPTVGWQIKQLHCARQVYVHSYSQQRSKTHTQIWAVGDRPDAIKGVATPDAVYDELDDRRTKRLTEEQIEAIDAAREQRRIQALSSQIKPFRDPMVWALFGGVAA